MRIPCSPELPLCHLLLIKGLAVDFRFPKLVRELVGHRDLFERDPVLRRMNLHALITNVDFQKRPVHRIENSRAVVAATVERGPGIWLIVRVVAHR